MRSTLLLLYCLTATVCVVHGIIDEDVVLLWMPTALIVSSCVLLSSTLFTLAALYEIMFGTPLNAIVSVIHMIVAVEYVRSLQGTIAPRKVDT